MNKDYFLRELEYLLMDLSEDEREAALEYYRDYFDEAGPQHEEEMAARLGSPEKVAAELKAALAGDLDGGEFSERGYRDERFTEEKIPDHYTEVYAGEVIDEEKRSSGRRDYYDEEGSEKNSTNRRGGGLLLLILFLVFGLPVAGTIVSAGFSIVTAFFGLVFGILGGLFGLIVGGFASVFGLFAGGIGTVISGICNLATPAMGTMAIGAGFFMIAGSFLLLILVKWACRIAVPGVIQLIAGIVKKTVQVVKRLAERMFGKRGETR